MFDNIIILNESPKQPLISIDSEMSIEEFTEFFTEFSDHGGELEWSFNGNNPDTWYTLKESQFIPFVRGLDKNDRMGELTFHTVYPSFGMILAIPDFEKMVVKVRFITGVEEFWENEVCDDCFLQMFGNDDDREPSENVKEHVDRLIQNFPIIQHDVSRMNEFSKGACDCCGSKLHGRRHFLVCMKGE